MAIVYVLSDGTREDGSIKRSLRRDALAELAKLPRMGIRNIALERVPLVPTVVKYIGSEYAGRGLIHWRAGAIPDSEFSEE